MKLLGIALFIQIVLGMVFAAGIVTGTTGFALAAFCAWTPAAWMLGFAFARAPIRVSVGITPQMYQNGYEQQPQPIQRLPQRPPQQRKSRLENVER